MVETIIEDDATPGVVAADSTDAVLGSVGGSNALTQDSSASPADVRAMLQRCLTVNPVDGDDADDRPLPG